MGITQRKRKLPGRELCCSTNWTENVNAQKCLPNNKEREREEETAAAPSASKL